jgi:TRAP-type C4-dicarboxylate transport system permease large subunit
MFLGGILPAFVMLAATVCWGIFAQHPGPREAKEPYDWNAARQAIWRAKWELIMPVVAVGALFSGFATPVEASAFTALYALCVEAFIYKDLKLTTDVPRVMAECGLLIGGVLLVQSVALGFTNYLVDAEFMTRRRMGHQLHPFQVGIPSRTKPVLTDCRMPDGDLRDDCDSSTLDGNDRLSFRNRPDSSGNHLPR